MIFYNEEHKMNYTNVCSRMNNLDCYHRALAYLLALDNVLCEHIETVYDFEERCIIPAALSAAWQTDTSLKTTRLAFNLFTDSLMWCADEALCRCSVAEIFCSAYAPYYWQAVQLRYPEYTT